MSQALYGNSRPNRRGDDGQGRAGPETPRVDCRVRLFLRIATLVLAAAWLEPVLGHGLGVVVGLAVFFALAPSRSRNGEVRR